MGLILALEVARLARNSAEWYRLLDLAALAGVLIGDEDGVYDPREFNDRLLLGLRGTISEVELHCIKARLHGAELNKARRGELVLRLPIGCVRGREGRIELAPDQEVQGALRTVFAQFERLGSAMAVLHLFREHGLKLPRLRWSADEPDEIIWAKPSYQAMRLLLTNPIYAGAYAYGQRGRDREGGRSLDRSGPRQRHALDELEVLLQDHHPGYSTWDRYLANRAALRDNGWRVPASRGAPRAGSALLVGIVYCGRCGCRMRPTYSERSAASACLSRRQLYGEPICQSLPMPHIDEAVSAAFLAVIRPAAIETTLALAAEIERDQARIDHQWQLRLERARYEAERARRQFDRVEPENRLVARELERRWNDALRAVADVEAEYRRERERGLAPLTGEEQASLRHLVTDVPALWHAAQTTPEDRKRLLRCLIHEVILLRDDARPGAAGITTVRVGWRTGAWSELRVRRPGAGECTRTAQPLIERLGSLAQRHSDDRIAAVLNAAGQCTRQGLPWTYARVKSVRRAHAIPTACPIAPRGDAARGDGLVPASVAAARLGVTAGAILQWAHLGVLHGEQMAPRDPLWVRLTEEDVARLDGTLAAQGYGRWHVLEARRTLGLTDAELWQHLRAGQLTAYRVTTRRRWKWRISPVTEQPACAPAAHGAALM